MFPSDFYFQTLYAWPANSTQREILELHQLIFDNPQATEDVLADRFNSQKNGLILLAWQSQKLIGYKLGYERKAEHYYSWIGGVHPDWRQQGIAGQMMQMQHQWCLEQGYRTIRTHTKNKWREMIILNLRHGYDIIGTLTDELGEPKLILEKKFQQ